MRKTLVNILLACCAGVGAPTAAAAQDAGDTFVKVGLARTKLVDKGDIFTNGVKDPAADYTTRATHHGVLTAGYFPIDHVAIEASISTPATTDNTPAGSLAGLPNLGDDEFVLATIGASVHPFRGRVSPYVGGGLQVQLTTQERDGLGVDLNIPNAHGPYVQAGVNVALNSRLGLFFDVRKAFYHTNASGLLPLDATFTNFARVDAKAELDPLTLQVGVMARFGKNHPEPQADDGKWRRLVVKLGVSHLELADKAQMVVGGTALSGEGISTREHLTPSFQLGYFFTPNVAVNFCAGLPPHIDIFAAGSIGALPKLGEVTYGPTALTAQYHFNPKGRVRPHVGAGLSYMIVFKNKDGAFEDLDVKNDLAPALEAGVDFRIDHRIGLFVDVKKAFLRPKVKGTFAGAPVETTTRLDPWVFTGGLSFAF